MNNLQKFMYGLFALFGVVLLLFATGVFNNDQDGIDQPSMINVQDGAESDDIVVDQEGNDQLDQEQLDEQDLNQPVVITAGEATIEILEQGDLSQPMFTSYDYTQYDEMVEYKFDTTMSIAQVIGEGTDFFQRTYQELSGVYSYSIQGTEDGKINNALKYSDLQIEVDGSEMLLPQLEEAMEQLQGVFMDTLYEFQLTQRGEIENLSAQYLGDDMEGADYVQQFTETVRDIFFLLPEEPVGVGGSWRVDKQLDVDEVKVITSVVYTLESMENNQATLRAEVSQFMDGELIGTGEGSLVVRDDFPFPVSTDVVVNATVTIPMPGMEVVMQQAVSTITTLQD